ncbi:hypothetical protein I9W82_001976 [Candida metapsilosis]|uniref:P-loop containing nucleoside triphosphate hydrolase protein n=1 Tax=Candida metapsilosis TaxID=273372 RepID=A0A8H8DDN7_9ASCO|nr:hypothetical protein I9W82_001976 [Candida metapsilosis]
MPHTTNDPNYALDNASQPHVEQKPTKGNQLRPRKASKYRAQPSETTTVYSAGIFIIGDDGVGKSSLIQAYKNSSPALSPQPNQSNECHLKMEGPMPNDMPFLLKISHSVGSPEKEHPSRYFLPIPDDIVLLCFALNDLSSLLSVRDKWYPRMRQVMYSRRVPIILVGTKSDIRARDQSRHIQRKARKVGREIGAIAFMTCSSRTFDNVQNVFNVALEHLHKKWAPGLAKVYERNLLPNGFENEVLGNAKIINTEEQRLKFNSKFRTIWKETFGL